MSKLLLFYNLLITALFMITGFAAAHSLNQLLFSLLFLPLSFYFLTRIFAEFHHPLLLATQNLIPYTYRPQTLSADGLAAPTTTGLTGTTLVGDELTATEVSDINRRLFLKLIGTAGLTTFLFALFTKSSHAAFFGSMPGPGTVSIKDSHGNKIDPSEKQPTDGYEVCDLDDTAIPAYYGFINKDGAWYIAREGNGGEYRYTRGGSDFADSWARHDALSYGYFNDVF